MSTCWKQFIISKKLGLGACLDGGSHDGDRRGAYIKTLKFSKLDLIKGVFSYEEDDGRTDLECSLALKIEFTKKDIKSITFIDGANIRTALVDYIYLYNIDDNKWYTYHFGDLVT
jgi:hypothetical protein